MGTTPRLGLPYPEPTASVDVPRDIKALALKLDGAGLPYAAEGGWHLANSQGGPAGAVFVTFKSGRFATTPAMTVSCISDVNYYGAATNLTKDGCRIWACHYDGTPVQFEMYISYVAVQMGATTPGNFRAVATTFTATCRTAGCENADIPIVLSADEEPDAPVSVAATPVFCGVCKLIINDRT